MKFLICWILVGNILLFVSNSAAAQEKCQATYASLEEFKTLAQFGLVSGPGAFKRMVENSLIGQTLTKCPDLADKAWDDVVRIGQEAQKQPATDHKELRAALLIVVYGRDLKQGHLEKLKSFIRLRPWDSGLLFAAHLAVDVLLLYNNDSSRNGLYNTYTTGEMERALKKYASP